MSTSGFNKDALDSSERRHSYKMVASTYWKWILLFNRNKTFQLIEAIVDSFKKWLMHNINVGGCPLDLMIHHPLNWSQMEFSSLGLYKCLEYFNQLYSNRCCTILCIFHIMLYWVPSTKLWHFEYISIIIWNTIISHIHQQKNGNPQSEIWYVMEFLCYNNHIWCSQPLIIPNITTACNHEAMLGHSRSLEGHKRDNYPVWCIAVSCYLLCLIIYVSTTGSNNSPW